LKSVRLDRLPCPRCGQTGGWKRYTNSRCRHACGMTQAPTNGTIFYRSHLPLRQAYYGLLLFANLNLGLRTDFVANHLGLLASRAVGLIARMRDQAALLEHSVSMGGAGKLVYVDEMQLNVRRSHGGKNPAGRYPLIILGMRCEDRVQLFIIPERSMDTLRAVIGAFVLKDSVVITDGYVGYNFLKYGGWKHSVINHCREWVNSEGYHHGPIDSIFGQLRRFLRGTVLSHSSKFVWEYIREFQFRFNRRWKPDRRFLDLIENHSDMTESAIDIARNNCDLRQFFTR
jgi:transposase